ncbi:MAG: Nif3-like dinuclear metal center hexameric protein [Spirochaetae bacterium HGW-Spirochaetae-3]|jgi:dinuclear metal center YbgI/SA1388 family protein|nr:MAG: Nif3-like dinuclear metal center hexameric protein [Spirochaetae bacterium HGW-Spirochaetae-3]
MNIAEFDDWAQALLGIPKFKTIDDSLNGLQVGRSAEPIRKMAFAVDACAESIRRARDAGAQALFVHHGLFWGKPAPITGALRGRIADLLAADMALYACHLPLDAHVELGNNAVLAGMLGLRDILPFGEYHGVKIGLKGRLEPALPVDEIVRRVLPDGGAPRSLLPFGPKVVSRVAVVSGGAAFESLQAISEGIELYVTGEPSHSIYHEAMEAGLNFVAAGHYATEVHGVKAVAERVARELGIQTIFIEYPTGL